jgi:hypothetical protein
MVSKVAVGTLVVRSIIEPLEPAGTKQGHALIACVGCAR